MIFNMLLIKVTDDNSWRAGDKDNKHHLFEADENSERALQYFFSIPKTQQCFRECQRPLSPRKHPTSHMAFAGPGWSDYAALSGALSANAALFPQKKAPCLQSKAQVGKHRARPVQNQPWEKVRINSSRAERSSLPEKGAEIKMGCQ